MTGKHSIKTGFEGRFYYVDNDSADGTASYNFNSAQTNLPGFDQQTGYSYASFLLGAVQTSSRPVQAVNPDYYQRDYSFYVQDDFKVSPKLTLNLGLRWTIVPGLYEKNGYVTNLDLSLPNPAAGNRPGALRFADQEGEKTFIDTDYGALEPRVGVAYAVSDKMAISGGYSVSHRAATAYGRGGDDFGSLDSTGYNANISVTRTTRPTPNAQDPVMYLSEAYPSVTGTLPNYDPSQQNNQGFDRLITGNEARRETYHNFNVTVRRQLPANFSMTLAYIGAQGRDLPFDLLNIGFGGTGIQLNRIPFDARRTVRRSAVQQPVEPAAAGNPPCPIRVHGDSAAGAAPVPAVHGHHGAQQLPRQDEVQLAADDAGAALQQGFLAGRRLHPVEDRRQLPQAGRVRRGVGSRRRGPSLPTFPEADLDL